MNYVILFFQDDAEIHRRPFDRWDETLAFMLSLSKRLLRSATHWQLIRREELDRLEEERREQEGE